MDRNSIIGLVLIAGILVMFTLFNRPDEDEKKSKSNTEQTKPTISAESDDTLTENTTADSLISETVDTISNSTTIDTALVNAADSLIRAREDQDKRNAMINRYGDFYTAINGTDSCYLLENDFLRMVVCNKGAVIKRVELKEYMSYQAYDAGKSSSNDPLILIDSTNHFAFDIIEPDQGRQYSSDDLYFNSVKLTDSAVVFTAEGQNNKSITIAYRITDDYEVKMRLSSSGLPSNTIMDNLVWEQKARTNEKSRDSENQVAGVFYQYQNDSRDLLTEGTDDEEEIEAPLTWIAFKQSFFSSVLILDGKFSEGGSMMHRIYEDGDYLKKYKANFKNPGLSPNTQTELTWYFGPNDYDRLAAYDNGMERILNHGWKIFGWINRNFFLPLFEWLHGFGMGSGLIILLMTLIIRFITMPLVFRNYRSSAKMKLLKPEIEEIAKKFPDQKDAMKKQQATMALYRSTGVNPLAGCVPMLIQMPILFAMFRLVPTLLDLRQESFLWADDLSSYDAIVEWSGHITLLSDFYGNHVSLFTLLMAGATLGYTLVNMNQVNPTQPGMPNMKFIMYLFPIMMIFFFNKYSSGLSYYYFLSSLFSMGVMFIIKRYFIDEAKLRAKLDENKKKPKKKSRFQQRLEEMQKQQAQRKR